ncbi:MAG: hypothetical protein E7208_05930 [Clostridium butyricum]|nr:hypothetical protein [Clostridium butyricum]
MQNAPTEKAFYFHTMMFSKNNGINNVWGYFPNTKSLLGYIQYSFLQESFYKWIYGKIKTITKIPFLSVDNVVNSGVKEKIIDKNTAKNMKEDYEFLSKLWEMRSSNIQMELKKFSREFNKKWMGDTDEFIYIKFFSTPIELADCVVSSSIMTSTEEELEEKLGMSLDEWRELSSTAITNEENGEKFRKVLFKKLTEVF